MPRWPADHPTRWPQKIPVEPVDYKAKLDELSSLGFWRSEAILGVPRRIQDRQSAFDWLKHFAVTQRWRDFTVRDTYKLIVELPTMRADSREKVGGAALGFMSRMARIEYQMRGFENED